MFFRSYMPLKRSGMPYLFMKILSLDVLADRKSELGSFRGARNIERSRRGMLMKFVARTFTLFVH